MKVENLGAVIMEYKAKSAPTDRYTSFDYCYNHFKNTDNLRVDIEKSCLVLGFYLASWGMLRGSSFLLQKSIKHLQPLAEYYLMLDKDTWYIDIDNYTENNIQKIIEIYNNSKRLIIDKNNSHLTLITKILLGVFGFIPAFDQFFCKTFKTLFYNKCGFATVNTKSLNLLSEFYFNNEFEISEISKNTFTTDFTTANKTNINYPKAKIVDMYGFTQGLK
ncbi:hypothetical protein VUJ46_12285 [Chryseobacterium sp. MYb264]|uniref:hypothetical protein n=1 Tax=Chryseobacterium sp. MYb264 TaxID=2745153 RepID=UPI002E14E4D3|nr:hypothetical protein VUJ46_12285 [Chryseobacterium sp. MYb264]